MSTLHLTMIRRKVLIIRKKITCHNKCNSLMCEHVTYFLKITEISAEDEGDLNNSQKTINCSRNKPAL